MRKAAIQYLRLVKKNLRCPHSLKAEFLRQLEDDIFLYCEEHEPTHITELTKHFGSPELLAKEFLSELDGETVTKVHSSRAKMILFFVAVLLVFLLVVAVRDIYVQNLFLDSYYVEYITHEGESQLDETQPIYGIETFTFEE